MCQGQWFTNGIRGLKVEGLIFFMTNWTVTNPPYSLDLASMDFAFFPYFTGKLKLCGQRFSNLQYATKDINYTKT